MGVLAKESVQLLMVALPWALVMYGPVVSPFSVIMMTLPAWGTTLPNWSTTATMNGLKIAPAVVLFGCVRNVSATAATAETLNLIEEMLGSPLAEATRE